MRRKNQASWYTPNPFLGPCLDVLHRGSQFPAVRIATGSRYKILNRAKSEKELAGVLAKKGCWQGHFHLENGGTAPLPALLSAPLVLLTAPLAITLPDLARFRFFKNLLMPLFLTKGCFPGGFQEGKTAH